jgi:hypothetical protein
VFEKMRYAGLCSRLIACARFDEEADGDRARRRANLADDGEAVWKDVLMEDMVDSY